MDVQCSMDGLGCKHATRLVFVEAFSNAGFGLLWKGGEMCVNCARVLGCYTEEVEDVFSEGNRPLVEKCSANSVAKRCCDDKMVETAAELLTKIEAKLASSFQREIHKQDIPALLFPHPRAVLDKKHNINVYLAFGFRTTSEPVKRARLAAFQIVSDYCLGLEVSELQKDKIYNGFQFEAIAADIEELLKPYNVSFLASLRKLVKSMRGEEILWGSLDE
jgi:hypothetical protein